VIATRLSASLIDTQIRTDRELDRCQPFQFLFAYTGGLPPSQEIPVKKTPLTPAHPS
jgi:hypothetical protein